MMKFILTGLLASAALVPVVATAQDRSMGDVMQQRMRARVDAQGERRSADRGQWQRGDADRPRPPEARPQPQQQPQPDRQAGEQVRDRSQRADRDDRGQGGNWRQQQERGDRAPGQPGGWQRPDPASQQRQQQARGGWQQDRDGRNWRSERQGDDRFDRADRRTPQDAFRRDGSRWNGDRNAWNDRGNDRRDWNDRGNDRRDWNDRSNDRRDWNRSWRRDTRYDWNRYRTQNRSAYRLPRYYAPYGWDGGYQRFSIGVRLSSVLFAQNYWIDDPWSYRLPDAYGPYRWVRYYDDALLVDIYTGQVVDVINGIFW